MINTDRLFWKRDRDGVLWISSDGVNYQLAGINLPWPRTPEEANECANEDGEDSSVYAPLHEIQQSMK